MNSRRKTVSFPCVHVPPLMLDNHECFQTANLYRPLGNKEIIFRSFVQPRGARIYRAKLFMELTGSRFELSSPREGLLFEFFFFDFHPVCERKEARLCIVLLFFVCYQQFFLFLLWLGFSSAFPFFCCTCWCVFNFSLSPLRCVLLRFSFLAASSTFAFITQNLVAFKERATFLSVFTRFLLNTYYIYLLGPFLAASSSFALSRCNFLFPSSSALFFSLSSRWDHITASATPSSFLVFNAHSSLLNMEDFFRAGTFSRCSTVRLHIGAIR